MSGDAKDMIFTEYGLTGLTRYSGFVFEEFIKELQGQRGMAIYREMRDNDPTVGAMLFAFEQLIRRATWRVDAASEDPVDARTAEFVRSCIDDMSATWTDTIGEIMSMVAFGFSYHEIVYKRRLGSAPGRDSEGNELPASKHADGLIGWRRLPIRAQETVWMWKFRDSDGAIEAMIQRSPPHFKSVEIPIEKALLFRHRTRKNNPEGVSGLRNAYRPWYFKKKIEAIEGIGIERDLAGLPVAYVPPEILAPGATADQVQTRNLIQKIITNIRRDEQEGILWPLAYDENGKKTFELSLLSTGGRRQFDTNAIVDRYNTAIAQTLLSDMILIGSGGRGSYALMEAKVDLFSQALEGWLDSITEVFNRYAIPRLLAVNGMASVDPPHMAHGPVDSPDLKDLSDYVTALSGAGMLTPNPNDEGYFRQIARIPAATSDAGNTAVGQ